MLKRLFASSVFSLCLVGLMATNSAAICRLVTGKMVCSDICLQYFLTGVGNVDVNTVAVCGGIYIDKVTGQCLNQPYNATNAQGTVFYPALALTQSGFVTAQNLTGERGQAEVELCLGAGFDEAILEWLFKQSFCSNLSYTTGYCDFQPENGYCSGATLCPNKNWWFDPCSVKIDVIYVYYSAWQVDKRTGRLAVSSQICRRCEPSVDPNAPCGFDCSDVSSSECQTRGLNQTCDSRVNE